ncbi:nitrate reductase gamma subunit [Gammaproteobacteria bacterium]
MTVVTVLYALLFYAAAAILVIGVLRRIVIYARVPAPLRITTMPAPLSRAGVVLRMVREVFFFESLFKSTKWTWLFGWLFHICMAVVLLRHLRYFQQPVWWGVEFIQFFGKYAAFGMVAGLGGLLARRLYVDRVRYISAPSDHLMLILLLAIALSGLTMTFVVHTDIVALKAFFLGLMRFAWQPLPPDPILLLHLTLVITLMVIFPISKLLHVPGIFFSPTRNQVDDARERRHVAAWARDDAA